MSNREEFEKWAQSKWLNVCWFGDRYSYTATQARWEAWQARQPEIDALIHDNGNMLKAIAEYDKENAALKAENERLRKDAERYLGASKIINNVLHDNITAMQSAFIEWRHGKGAEKAMEWIANTLFGPGLLPDENSPYGRDAQSWFDANQSNPFPKCSCGKPSNIVWMGRGFCSEDRFDATIKEMN